MNAPSILRGTKWTEVEKEILRKFYGRRSPRAIQLLLKKQGFQRTENSIMGKGAKMGLGARRRWKPEEEEYIRNEWDFSTLQAIAKALRRTPLGVKNRAVELGLPMGPPEGAETIKQACKRTGFAHVILMKILAFSNVEISLTKRWPGQPSRIARKYREKKRKLLGLEKNEDVPIQSRGKCIHRFVYKDEVDRAVANWVGNIEDVASAAKRRGLVGETLRRWLREAGFKSPPHEGKRHCVWRLPTKDIDKAIELRRTKNIGKETLTDGAKRLGVSCITLESLLRDVGITKPFRGHGKHAPWFIDTTTIDRVFEEAVNSGKKVWRNGLSPYGRTRDEFLRRRWKKEPQIIQIMMAVRMPWQFVRETKLRLSKMKSDRLPPVEKIVGSAPLGDWDASLLGTADRNRRTGERHGSSNRADETSEENLQIREGLHREEQEGTDIQGSFGASRGSGIGDAERLPSESSSNQGNPYVGVAQSA